LSSNGFLAHGVPIEFDGSISSGSKIRRFVDILDVLTMEIPPVEFIVPALGIAKNTISLWTGPDGDGKSYVAQAMSVAVARGEPFLGMATSKCPVLYLDFENPAHAIQDRLQSMTPQSISDLRIWGIWNEQQPPMFGSELLLQICKDTKPLLIVDPFVYFHSAKENVSDEMGPVDAIPSRMR
jgi:hypothetical protein